MSIKKICCDVKVKKRAGVEISTTVICSIDVICVKIRHLSKYKNKVNSFNKNIIIRYKGLKQEPVWKLVQL